MKKIIFVILPVLLFAACGSFSQGTHEGHLKIVQNPLVDTLLSQYRAAQEQILANPDNKGIPGYRIQIYFDSGANSGSRARDMKFEFEYRFPEVPAYVTWKAPTTKGCKPPTATIW